MSRVARSQISKTEGYRQLVEQFGIETVADRLLAKWLADSDADETWDHLAAVVALTDMPVRLSLRQRLVLWRLSQGWSVERIADDFGSAVMTVQMHTRAARKKLGVTKTTQAVAKAIRLGLIP